MYLTPSHLVYSTALVLSSLFLGVALLALLLQLRERWVDSPIVVVETEATSQYRKLYAGSTGYGSSGPPEAHFGLGAAESVSRVVVYWPDGVVSELRDVEARQILTIRRM